jgi:outer membrane protein insertion porin family
MKLYLILLPLLFLVPAAYAQDNFMINSISFVGNKSLKKDNLRRIMLTKDSPAGIWRFTYRLGHIIGDSAKYLDPLVLRADLQRIKQYYFDNGFPYARVDSSLKYDEKDRSVDITVKIAEGPPAIVTAVHYHGVADTTGKFTELLDEKPFISRGDRYSASKVDAEVQRVIGLLQNDGYAYSGKDSSVVTYSVPHDSVSTEVDLYFHSGRQFRWGNLSVLPVDSGKIPFEKNVVLREMLFNPGDIYSLSKKTQSEQRLYSLNMFEMARITTPERPPAADSLPGDVSLRLRPSHEITPELLVDDENNAFNFGGGLGYLHRDFLGDARLLSINTSLLLQSFQLVTFSSKVLSDTVTVGRIDATAQLTQPYFFSNATSLTWGVSFLVDKQMPYVQLVLRNKVRVSDRLAEYTMGYIDWDLERAKVDSLQAIPLPAGLETPQFNSILSITLQRDKTNDVFFPTGGFLNMMTVEEGGVIPNFIHSLFKHSDFPYAQYWKITLLGKWFFALNENATDVFAMKAKVGYAQEYGTYQENQNGPIPLTYRFFAGGSGSIRGWRTRELGNVSSPEYGGNMLIETNLENRFDIAGDFGGVLFVDAGNLWNSYKQVTLATLAAATGFGLRYKTFFGPLRVDFGFRLYDPGAPEGQRFIYQKSGKELVREMVVHFGILQAF